MKNQECGENKTCLKPPKSRFFNQDFHSWLLVATSNHEVNIHESTAHRMLQPRELGQNTARKVSSQILSSLSS